MTWWEWLLVALAPVELLVAFALLTPLVEVLERYHCARRCRDTFDRVTDPSFCQDLISINGQRGAGKTTLLQGLGNYLTIYLRDNLVPQDLEALRPKLKRLPMDRIDALLGEMAAKKGESNAWRAMSTLRRSIKGLDEQLKGVYWDHLYPLGMEVLLRDYVTAKLAQLRDNYDRFHLSHFRSPITGKWALPLNPQDLDMRLMNALGTWRIGRYEVVMDDDTNIFSGSTSEHPMQAAQDNGGKDALFRIWRHSFKGRSYYVSTSQVFARQIKGVRESIATILEVKGRTEDLALQATYYPLCLLPSFLDSLDAAIDSVSDRLVKSMRAIGRNPAMRLIPWLESAKARRKERRENVVSWAQDRAQTMKCDTYVSIKTTRADNDPNNPDGSGVRVKNVTLFFPTTYAHGSVYTYELNVVEEEMEKKSVGQPNDTSIVSPRQPNDTKETTDFINAILSI